VVFSVSFSNFGSNEFLFPKTDLNMQFLRIAFLLIFLINISVLSKAQRLSEKIINRPRLVVIINVEQMRHDYLSRYSNKFQKDGFNRFIKNGTECVNAKMDLPTQKNISGVATLFTGTYPDRHGIIDREWYDRLKDEKIDALEDTSYMTVGSDSEEGRKSSANLLNKTIGDELKIQTHGKAKVFTVGLNDYSAVLSAGHTADGAYWLDKKTGKMISSSYFEDSFPSWAFNFNERKYAQFYIESKWELLLDKKQYVESYKDKKSVEEGLYGKWKSFPYSLKKIFSEVGDYRILKAVPFGNDMVTDFTLSLISGEHLGIDEYPDLLVVNYSSMDFANSSFGPNSLEMEDTYLRMDKNIQKLLNDIDKRLGLDKVLVVLSSNCSSSYSMEYMKENFNLPVGYVHPEKMVALLKSYLNITYGQGDWIDYYTDQQIYLNHALARKKKIDWRPLQSSVASFINQFSGIRMALPGFDLERGDYVKSQLTTLSRSYNFRRSGDILFQLENGWQPKYKFKKNQYSDNQHIPMLWLGGWVRNCRDRDKTDAIDIAPTVLEILGLEIPSYCEGRILKEIIKE